MPPSYLGKCDSPGPYPLLPPDTNTPNPQKLCGFGRIGDQKLRESAVLLLRKLRNRLGLHEVEGDGLGVGLLDVSHILVRIADLVEGDGTGDAVDGHGRQSLGDINAVDGISSLDGLDGDHVRVIAQRGDSRDDVVVAVVGLLIRVRVQPGLEALNELSRNRVAVVLVEEGGAADGQVGALRRVEDNGGLPGIAGQNRHRDVHGSSLVDQQRRNGGAGRAEDDVRAAVDRVGQVSGVVRGALGELLVDDLAAHGLEILGEVGRKTGGVVVAQLGEDVRGLRAELVLGEVRHDGALERIQEADAPVVIAQRSDARVGAGAANRRNLSVGEDFAAGHGDAGAVGTQNDAHAGVDQLLSSGDGLIGRGLVVHDHQLDVVGLAADFDGGNQRIGILDADHFLLAARAVVTGRRLENADLHGISHRDGSRENQGKNHNQSKNLFHCCTPP